jgi:hypothetical protein
VAAAVFYYGLRRYESGRAINVNLKAPPLQPG